jgi:photosystem II stability/assembly factor-like uncharacterized protein
MRIPLVLVCAAALARPLGAHAGVNAFTPTGPEGASGFEIEFVGAGALVVATYRGIYRSTDGGANWTLTRGIKNFAAGHLAVNPANRNQVLFGTDGGLIRSSDGGATWTQVEQFPPAFNNDVSWVQFSNDGSLGYLAMLNGHNLYRSADGGVTWAPVNTGLANPVTSIAIDVANPQRLYFQSVPGYVYSSDGGASSTPMNFANYLHWLAPSRTTANTALVYSNDIYRLFRTTNGGVDWTMTAWAPAIGRQLTLLQYVPGTAGKAFVQDSEYRLYRLRDDGEDATDLGFPECGQIWGLAFDPVNPAHMFAAAAGGIFESSDDGVTWSERNHGLREGNALGVFTSNAGTGAVYLMTRNLTSLHRRADNGDWNAVGRNSSPLLGYATSFSSWSSNFTLGVSQQDAQRVYMSRDGKFGVSTDGGVTWNLLSTVPEMQGMSVSTVNDQLIFLSNFSPAPIRSANGGQTWTSLSGNGLPPFPNGARHFAFDPTNANVVYASVGQVTAPAAAAVFKSVDAGLNFSPTAWNPQHVPGAVWKLVHDPVRVNILYLVGFDGLYKTSDGGATWTRTPLFNDGQQVNNGPVDLVIDPNSPDVLYASSWTYQSLARSVNGGATWDLVRDGDGDEAEQFTHIALVPGTRGKIVAQRWYGSREFEFVARVALSPSAASATLNTPASTVLTVVNQGDFAVSATRLTATLPIAAGTPTVTASNGICLVTGGTSLTCELGNIAAKGQATVTVGYTPTQAGSWSAVASVYEREDTSTDNTTQITMAAAPPPAPPPKESGGGGRFDYLVLAGLLALLLNGRRRSNGVFRRVRQH